MLEQDKPHSLIQPRLQRSDTCKNGNSLLKKKKASLFTEEEAALATMHVQGYRLPIAMTSAWLRNSGPQCAGVWATLDVPTFHMAGPRMRSHGVRTQMPCETKTPTELCPETPAGVP